MSNRPYKRGTPDGEYTADCFVLVKLYHTQLMIVNLTSKYRVGTNNQHFIVCEKLEEYTKSTGVYH